jgi:hypothetical protein
MPGLAHLQLLTDLDVELGRLILPGNLLDCTNRRISPAGRPPTGCRMG